MRFRSICLTLLGALMAALVSCGGGGGGNNNNPPAPPVVQWTISVTPTAGFTFDQSFPLTVKDGDAPTLSGRLDIVHYESFTMGGMNGTFVPDGAKFTYVLPPVHTSGTLVPSDKSTVSVEMLSPGKIAYVIDPAVDADMHSLLVQWMDTIARETQTTGVVMTNFTDPPSIRVFLKSLLPDLRLVFLVGKVPVVQETYAPMFAGDPGMGPQTSDAYYTRLNFPFESPVPSGGVFNLPTPIDSHALFGFDGFPVCAVARIEGLADATRLADIRAYLSKNLALRGNLDHYPQGATFVDSIPEDGGFRYADTLAAISPILPAPLTLFKATGGTDGKQAFLQGVHSSRFVYETAHAASHGIAFMGDTWDFDEQGLNYMDITKDYRALHIRLHSCDTADIAYPECIANQMLHSGDVLLVEAAPEAAIGSADFIPRVVEGYYRALFAGRTAFRASQFTTWVQPIYDFLGDPTIVLARPSAEMKAPKLEIMGTPCTSECVIMTDLTNRTEYNVLGDVLVRNTGSADLVLVWTGESYATTAALDDQGSHWWVDGFTNIDPFTTGCVVPTGGSVTIHPTLYRTSYGGVAISGTHSARFFFTCNDPNVGAFMIMATGTIN